ncbi:hypothetical protein [Bartonella tamiae]|uniref:DUF2232 domain-containing protein n=1 Tax=Bartonella tamiae Th239 TaxID=1094558 RepID=J0R4R5_9HYPH|nr:hypothetical protein [Bartonella tamiae]EJF90659.1 hypothetical protein ME5_01060 [Bartonella tamiae Th239]EJF93964.1 hypothetical protein MEG_00822 [Bartonella tamiae Th307]
MPHANQQGNLIGILAGLITTAISMAVTSLFFLSPSFSLLLGCFISLPIFVVAFGWGTKSSIIALMSATIIFAIARNISFSLGFLFLFFLPAVYASWLLGLAQTDDKSQKIHWYPLSNAIFLLTSFVSIICILVAAYFLNDPSMAVLAEKVFALFNNTIQQNFSLSEIEITNFRNSFIANFVPLLAFVIAIYSLIFLLVSLYFSLITAQKMKRLARPRDDWPKNFRLPKVGLLVFGLAFIASFFQINPFIDLIAIVFNATFSLVISISGLAYLHNITRGIKGRIVILTFIYIALFTFVFAVPISILLLMLGVWATLQHQKETLQQ